MITSEHSHGLYITVKKLIHFELREHYCPIFLTTYFEIKIKIHFPIRAYVQVGKMDFEFDFKINSEKIYQHRHLVVNICIRRNLITPLVSDKQKRKWLPSKVKN